MTQQNVAAPGSQTFVHGTVLSVMFNTQVPKKGGGVYTGTTLNFQTTQGQASTQNWAQQIIDDARNIEIRNALVALSAAPGSPFTIHKTKNEKGFWNVDRIDMGHVEGVRTTTMAAPVAPGGAPLVSTPGAVAIQPENRSDKMRSKEACMRGEAIQASSTLAKVGGNGQVDLAKVIADAEIIYNYIENGLAVPVAAPVAAPAPVAVAPVAVAPVAPVAPLAPVAPIAAPVAPVAAPVAVVAPAPIPVIAAAPVPVAPVAVAAPVAPAPAPVPAAPIPVAAPVPIVAAPVVAVPGQFDDGFGGPGA